MPLDARLDILQVSTRDLGGGAERVAHDLFATYRARGHRSWLAVGYKHTEDPNILAVPQEQGPGVNSRFWWGVHRRLQPHYGRWRGSRWLCRTAHRLAEPGSLLDCYRGHEDFRYPGTRRLLDTTPEPPQVLHAHNLHGYYFDLGELPALSRRLPVVLTLHDAWLLSGHCAHSFDCDRWRRGCGNCPDLTIYPSVRRDATAFNWKRKRDIFRRSKLHVATPCHWLMRQVEESILGPGMVSARVIPYGIDLSVFHPGDRRAARDALGIPQDAHVLLFAGNNIRRNPFKDFATMRAALAKVAAGDGVHGDGPSGHASASPPNALRVMLLALGEEGPPERIGAVEVSFVPYTADPGAVAKYYQAADLYVHAARADTFPNTILEALACGTPVVATAVGGIPEEIRPLRLPGISATECGTQGDAESATGVLVPPSDPASMAGAIRSLLSNAHLRHKLGGNAADDARARFDLQRQADDYLNWYAELLDLPSSGEPRHAVAPAAVTA